MFTCDTYLTPETLTEALTYWEGAVDGSRLLAGATDTLPWARQGRAGDIAGDVHIPTIVDISRVSGLSDVNVQSDGRIRLGGNVSFQSFLEDPVLEDHLPHMPSCALWFADDQIRRQATIAGNIANASPAADGVPPLVALNADVELAHLDDLNLVTRTVPLKLFITGPGRTDLKTGEIITAITCDSARGYGGTFEKVGQRRSLVISVACAACCVKPNDDGNSFEDVRLSLGGVGPAPIRLDDVEDFLIGKPISREVISRAAEMPLDRVASRTRREYRRDVVRGFVERSLVQALANTNISVEAERNMSKGADDV